MIKNCGQTAQAAENQINRAENRLAGKNEKRDWYQVRKITMFAIIKIISPRLFPLNV